MELERVEDQNQYLNILGDLIQGQTETTKILIEIRKQSAGLTSIQLDLVVNDQVKDIVNVLEENNHITKQEASKWKHINLEDKKILEARNTELKDSTADQIKKKLYDPNKKK